MMRRSMKPRWVPGALALAFLVAGGWAEGAEPLRYNRDIRPILSDHCFQCHGPDAAQRKARLRVDEREAAVSSGVLVPGDPDGSEMVRRLTAEDPEELMPPASVHKPLTAEQIGLLRRWVAEGGEYEPHWSFMTVERPPVPDALPAGWATGHPVDALVRERLVQEGLEPAREADRRTLLRRLSLDLVGLPPTPEEAAAFERDTDPHAYERQVERLLASPHYGERQAIPWLDAVRFADTVGYHGDQNQRIFPYRDWVIEAFNRNLPFDQFTRDQLAGDLLPEPTVAQQVATGFNRLNMMTREGGAQPKEYLAKYQADRVRTVSTAWLGATLACAECHDHKYDPFTLRDFYAFSAFFADVQQWGVYQDYVYTPNPDLGGWSNDHPFPPEIEVESPALLRRIDRLQARASDLERAAGERAMGSEETRTLLREWRMGVRDFLSVHPDGWRVLGPREVTSMAGTNRVAAEELEWRDDGSVSFRGSRVTQDRFEFELPAGWVAALRLELLPQVEGEGLLRGGRRTATVQWAARWRRAGEATEEALRFVFADAVEKEPRYANGHDILGVHRGWRLPAGAVAEGRGVSAIALVERPWRAARGDVLSVTIPGNVARRVRISVSPLALEPGHWVSRVEDVAAPFFGEGADRGVPAAFHRSTAWDGEVLAGLRGLDMEIRECREGRAWTQVTVSTNALVTRELPRGNWMDESGEVVGPAPPKVLAPGMGGTGNGEEPAGRLSRLDLASWLTSRENPLTARNFVNRLWAQFFGAGISARIEDLGLQGEWPSHPELLDWLAAEFMEPTMVASPVAEGPAPAAWDMRHMVRLLVTSATYRQASEPSEAARERDPDNRWLSHQSPRRLEAELVRDNALAIAGLLEREVGGPSVFPYQPPAYYVNLQFPDRDYRADLDERQYRRGLYMHWQRTFLHPMLANFDAQSREECVASRLPSNTPQQALTLLNDPTFVEAGRVLAEGLMRDARGDGARVERLFRLALLRDPRPAERESLLRFVERQRVLYQDRPDQAAALIRVGNAPVAYDLPAVELAVWSNAARVVLNLHEVITRY
ncbi:MAG: PSD1 domain-containing protein [Verrucomicrobiae bacterium]|nr:PSD1 domain-containing protein [Verrucomicrobiae bacterium]